MKIVESCEYARLSGFAQLLSAIIAQTTGESYIMVLKGIFLYVIRTCISTYFVTLRCKHFSEWLAQNVNNS